MLNQDHVPIPGSEREPLAATLAGAVAAGAPDPNERIEVTLYLRATPNAARPATGALDARAPSARRYLSREEFAASYGAAPEDLDRIAAFAQDNGLTVVERSPERRSVKLAGTADALDKAFGVTLTRYEQAGRTYRTHAGPVHVPADLAGIVEGVFGLDNRPQASPRSRSRLPHAAGVSYTPLQIAQLYDFPSGSTGQGECIALIELGGGFQQSDLTTYFQGLGLAVPVVLAVSVDGGQNQPTGDASGPDGEVMLDIEVAGGVAPGAKVAVYFAPNTDQGFLDAVTTAAHDATNRPSVISISWGAAESQWTQQAMQAMDQAFQAAATMGVAVCVASGDSGSSDGQHHGNHVDFPASSPHALGCGGTSLTASGTAIGSEVVWNDGAQGGATGGGVSAVFPLPTWQENAHVPRPSRHSHGGRGVPDVAGDADPATGYQVRVDGQQVVYGGTSAVAPLWAGLLARVNQQLGQPVGYLNPLLYSMPASDGATHDITSGNNGAYQAGPGWDACTGLGSPDGAKLLAALRGGQGATG